MFRAMLAALVRDQGSRAAQQENSQDLWIGLSRGVIVTS
jgi:hypothetical protein